MKSVFYAVLTLISLFFSQIASADIYVATRLESLSANNAANSKEELNSQYDLRYKGYKLQDIFYETDTDKGRSGTIEIGKDFGAFKIQAFYTKGSLDANTKVKLSAEDKNYDALIGHSLKYSVLGLSAVGKVKILDNLNLEPELGIAKVCYSSNSITQTYKEMSSIRVYKNSACGLAPKLGIGMAYKLTEKSEILLSYYMIGDPRSSSRRVTNTSIGVRMYF